MKFKLKLTLYIGTIFVIFLSVFFRMFKLCLLYNKQLMHLINLNLLYDQIQNIFGKEYDTR